MEALLDFIEPSLVKVELWIRAIAADVPIETDWTQSSFGSW
jgi:hypothetical protein